jgi:hypothetical protein
VPRPLEPIKNGESYKQVSVRVSAADWERITDYLEAVERESGYPRTLQDFFEDLLREGLRKMPKQKM